MRPRRAPSHDARPIAARQPWSASQSARRFGRDIGALLLLKVVLLVGLWLTAVAYVARTDVSSAALGHHLGLAVSAAASTHPRADAHEAAAPARPARDPESPR